MYLRLYAQGSLQTSVHLKHFRKQTRTIPILLRTCKSRCLSKLQEVAKTDLLHMCGAHSSAGPSGLFTLSERGQNSSEKQTQGLHHLKLVMILVCFIYSMKPFKVLFIKSFLHIVICIFINYHSSHYRLQC